MQSSNCKTLTTITLVLATALAWAQPVEIKYARILTYQKKYKAAISAYLTYLKANPSDPNALFEIGDIYYWRQDYLNAIRYYSQNKKDKRFPKKINAIRNAILDTCFESSKIKKYLNLIPDDRALLERYADTLSWEGRYPESIKQYISIINETGIPSKQKNDLELKLSHVYSWAKQYDNAIQTLQHYLSNRPNDPKALKALAQILYWTKKYQESLTTYDLAYAASKDPTILYERNAKAAAWDLNNSSARNWLGKLVRQDPDNVEARYDLAQLSARYSLWEKADINFRYIVKNHIWHDQAKEGAKRVQQERRSFGAQYLTEKVSATSPEQVVDIDFFDHKFLLKSPYIQDKYKILGQYSYQRYSFTQGRKEKLSHIYLGLEYLLAPHLTTTLLFNNSSGKIRKQSNWIDLFITTMPKKGYKATLKFYKDNMNDNLYSFENNLRQQNLQLNIQIRFSSSFSLSSTYTLKKTTDNNKSHLVELYGYIPLMEPPHLLSIRPAVQNQTWNINKSDHYFSPKDFWTFPLQIVWHHELGWPQNYYGARAHFYEIGYSGTWDSNDEYMHGYKLQYGHEWKNDISISCIIDGLRGDYYKYNKISANISGYFF